MRIEYAKQDFHGGRVLPAQRDHLKPTLIDWVAHHGWPDALHLSLGQYFKDPATVTVGVGDRVLGHQALTVVDNDHQIPIHAPTSGVISARRQIGGHDCLVLTPDGAHTLHPPVNDAAQTSDWQQWPTELLIDRLRDRGLCGLGGARFPSAAKLRGPWPPPHTLILNGVECEPGTACDHALLREQALEVLHGGLILAKACGAKQLWLAIDDSEPALAQHLAEISEDADWLREAASLSIEPRLMVLPARYPAGSERQLIQQLTGQQVPLRGLPQDLGLVTHNVGTAAAAQALITTGQPLTHRMVTLNAESSVRASHDSAWRRYRMPFGLPIQTVLDTLGLSGVNVRIGGPLSGQTVTDLATPIHAGCHVLYLSPQRAEPEAMPCIQCSACVEVCPAQLMPQWLHRFLNQAGASQQPFDEDSARQLDACIACGLCDTVCPSQIPLTAQFRGGQQQLAAQRQAERQAALAKQRFEARQARLAREVAAREAKRQARQARLQSAATAQDEIAAALARAQAKSAPNSDSQ